MMAIISLHSGMQINKRMLMLILIHFVYRLIDDIDQLVCRLMYKLID